MSWYSFRSSVIAWLCSVDSVAPILTSLGIPTVPMSTVLASSMLGLIKFSCLSTPDLLCCYWLDLAFHFELARLVFGFDVEILLKGRAFFNICLVIYCVGWFSEEKDFHFLERVRSFEMHHTIYVHKPSQLKIILLSRRHGYAGSETSVPQVWLPPSLQFLALPSDASSLITGMRSWFGLHLRLISRGGTFYLRHRLSIIPSILCRPIHAFS